MRRFSQASTQADLYRISAAISAALLLVVLFFLTQPVDMARHNAIRGYFDNLQRDDSRQGEAVLQLYYNLADNYDHVTAINKDIRNAIRELQQGEAAVELRKDPELQQQLKVLEQHLVAERDALERFKSANAMLKNSLFFLPHVRDDLERALPVGTEIHESIDSLVEMVLLGRRGNMTMAGSKRTEAAIAALWQKTGGLQGDARKRFENLLTHVRLIDAVEREMPVLMRILTSRGEVARLAEAYQRYYDRQQGTSASYRFFLLLATLALLGYAASAFIRLREKSRSLQLAASVIANANDAIVITDREGRIKDVNPAFTRTTGYTRDEVVGSNPRLLKSGRHDHAFYEAMWRAIATTGQWQGEVWNRRKSGEIFPEWLKITTVTGPDNVDIHYVGSFIDISERKQSEVDLHNLAFYDQLTQLPNRRLLLERLEQALVTDADEKGHGALLFIGLDHFKALNDTRGHGIGDLLLKEVAGRLKANMADGVTIARLGGDEFVVLLRGLHESAKQAEEEARISAENILELTSRPYNLHGSEYHSTSSIGIILFRKREATASDLFKRADAAMHQAKLSGRNMLRFFDPSMQAELEARVVLETDLRAAIAGRQFTLYYQPQVDQAGRVIGAEALIRWMHPGRGMVSPGIFIPVAEEKGLVLPIGQWVLETACVQIKRWEVDPVARNLKVAVNVSAGQFRQPDFVEQVRTALEQADVSPGRLKLELTESMVLDDIDDTIAKMQALKQMGVGLSLDDFGTGHSSLAYLTRLPIDQLKIDQSFVRNLNVESTDAVIVKTIVGMAGNLGMEAIAEGVETQNQREFLKKIGCALYQGYLFGKPMPPEEFEARIKETP